jgi:hypothetical protein
VRADEKIDPLLELEVQKDQVEELEKEEQPDPVVAQEVDTSSVHFHELGAFIEALLQGDETDLEELEWLSDMERDALELLRHAIDGRRDSGALIYAEDRLEMLNLALAALQPALARGFETQAAVAQDLYRTLVEDIGEFQKSLESLSDAQEELLLREQLERMREGERPGKPKPKPIDQGEVGDNRPSQLATGGPAAPDRAPPPSLLAGPGPAVEKPAPPSALASGGPAAPDFVTPPSTLAAGGPAAPDKKPEPSTAWDGDDRRR